MKKNVLFLTHKLKIAQKYGVTPKHELMSQLMEINTE